MRKGGLLLVMYFTPGIRITSSWITHMLEESPNVNVVVTFQSYNVSFEAKKKKLNPRSKRGEKLGLVTNLAAE